MDLNTWGLISIAVINLTGVILTIFGRRDSSIIRQDIRKVELATNSMKDALVAATAKASLAEGLAQGRNEKKESSDV